ncbi:MAG: aldehyde dehydrogenase family protein [Gemmatimonadota bacterium]
MTNERYPLMIPGAGPGPHPLEVNAPFDGAPIATVETADLAAVDRALGTAEALYRDRDAWLKPHERIAILETTSRIMEERAEELAAGAAQEGGKPLLDSRVEVGRAIEGVKLCIDALRTGAGTEIPMGMNPASIGRLAFTRREPIGVILAFSAFNHPLNLIVHQVGPAVAAGCPVIVKPAEATPLSCFRFVEILREAGLPEEWCQAFAVADLEVAGALVTDPRVAFFTFIGSARVGWMLRSRLAPGTRCALEHGGAAPVIVAADADVEDALPRLAKGGLYHAGQVCVSVQRVFAQESIARDVAQRLAGLAAAMSVGDPTTEETEVGPLIRPSEVERVGEWVEEAASGGGELLTGGERISDSCYRPTVLYDPPADARVSTLEIFGPVICVYPYRELDEAVERANALPYAFQAAVFTRDIDAAVRAAERLDAAAVIINDHTAFRVDWMPFAGLKQSGLGVGGIPYTLRDMQVEKLWVLRSRALG